MTFGKLFLAVLPDIREMLECDYEIRRKYSEGDHTY
jgi:hypothetical protein